MIVEIALTLYADLRCENHGVCQRHRQPHTEKRMGGGRIGGRKAGRAFCFCPAFIDPVSLALKRVGGQRHAPATAFAMKGGPVHLNAVHVQRGQVLENLRPIFLALAQRGHPGSVIRRHAGPAHAQQRRVRPKLEKDLAAHFLKRVHRSGKAHGLAHVPAPVDLRIGKGAGLMRGRRRVRLPRCDFETAAGDIGNHRHARRPEGNLSRDSLEGIKHRLHQGRMKGV